MGNPGNVLLTKVSSSYHLCVKWELWKTFDTKIIGWTHFSRNRQKYFYQCRFDILKWLRISDRSKIGVIYSSNALQGCCSRLHEFSFVYFDLVVFWFLSLRLHWSQLDFSYFLSWHTFADITILRKMLEKLGDYDSLSSGLGL